MGRVQSNTGRPSLIPSHPGYQGGPRLYTQKEVDEIYSLSIKAMRVKKERENRRKRLRDDLDKVNKAMEKLHQDVQEINDKDEMELNKLMGDGGTPFINLDSTLRWLAIENKERWYKFARTDIIFHCKYYMQISHIISNKQELRYEIFSGILVL